MKPAISLLSLPALCVLFAAVPAAAQTTVTLVAATPIAAMTRVGAGATTFQGIPAGQSISASPNQVFLSTNQAPTGLYLSATTICYPTSGYQGGAGFNFFERAYARGSVSEMSGSSASPAAGGATFGPHAVLATFAAAPGTVGRIVVSYRRNVAAGGATAAAVDIGNDGTAEFAQATAAEWSAPHTMGPSGQVVVRVANGCHQPGNGTSTTLYSWTEMWVGFQPDLTATCTITPYGQGCAGVQAAGTELVVGGSRTTLVLATGCFPSSPAVFVFGSQQLGLPLLNGCSLLCNADGFWLATTDATGNVTASWTQPVTTVGTHHVQFLSFGDVGGVLAMRASNGLTVACTL